MKLKNPLIDEPGMSDPHMLVRKEACYLFTGHDVGHGVKEWVMPDWRIFRSEDLSSWEHVGTISPSDNYMGEGNTNCWAGDIAERNGRFYWYFSNHNKETGVMVADRPEGPYTDVLGGPLVDSFDPTIFTDDDGTPYIVYGAHDYKIARLKDSMVELDEEPKVIPVNRKDTFNIVDKSSLHKRDGIYYLGCSAAYATSKNIYGPYEYQGRVGDEWGLGVSMAHGDFFEWKDQWYHVWCKYRNRQRDAVRDCFIAPVSYDKDGRMWDAVSDIPEIYRPNMTKL